MICSNFHMHSVFCDGKNTLEDMVKASVKAGLRDIGFTSHQPLPYANDFAMKEADVEAYVTEIHRLQEQYKNTINISLGMEIDYFIETQDIGEPAKRCLPLLDYFIGSIHTVGWMHNHEMADIDYTKEIFEQGIQDCFSGNAKAFVKAYYTSLGQMAETIQPDIIGHIDLIKKNNENNDFFDENALWYQKAVGECLDRIKETPCIIEVNTGGMVRYGERCRYPSDWILKEIYKRKIPVTLNGDSHSVDAVCFAYKQMEELMCTIGFKEIMVFKNGEWIPEAIE